MKNNLVWLSCLFIAGCGNSNSDAFVGKWSRIQNSGSGLNISLDIEKNGDTYLVKRTMPSFIDASTKTRSMPAVYKDGLLQVPSELLTYSVDKKTGHITDGKSEYEKTAK